MMDSLERDFVLDRGDDANDPSAKEEPKLRIRIRELPMADGVFASTGCQVWGASIMLAQELLRRPELVAGKKVVEVGAGCGLLGITIATLARFTLITDGDEECVRNLTHNLQANEVSWRSKEGEAPREVSTRILRWEDAVATAWLPEERAEVVIASDIIAGMFGNIVAQAFMNIVEPGGFVMLNAHEDRTTSVRGFAEHLADAGYSISESTSSGPYGQYRTYECWGAPPRREPPGKAVHSERPREAMQSAQPQEAVELRASTAPLVPEAAPARELPAAGPAVAESPVEMRAAPPAELPEELASSGGLSVSGCSGRQLPPALEQQQKQGCGALPLPGPPPGPPQRPEAQSGAPSGIVGTGSPAATGGSDGGTAEQSDPKAVFWQVNGGKSSDGILVRNSRRMKAGFSNCIGRLRHGSLVRAIESTKERLHYRCVCGTGPQEGWVSLYDKKGNRLLKLVT